MGGCSSSTLVTVDPHTGQTKTKKRLGGAYPGRRQTGAAPADAVAIDGVPTTHFSAVPGGNALQLVQGPPLTANSGQQQIQVTLPDGVSSGQTIHVQAPDGSVNAIVVPAGFGPGSTFTVAFDPATTPQQQKPATTSTAPMAEAYVPGPQQPSADDGFASGFGSSAPPPTVATAIPSNNYKY